MKALLILWLSGFLLGCASSEKGWMMPVGDENNQAPGAAYAAESMHFRKEMPHRPNPHPWRFYYKHCERNPERDHVSKTSYDCNGPF